MDLDFKKEWLRGIRLACILAVWGYLTQLLGLAYVNLGFPTGQVSGWVEGLFVGVLFVAICVFGPILFYRFARFFGVEISERWCRPTSESMVGVDQAREPHRADSDSRM
jgi:hypothetical protein